MMSNLHRISDQVHYVSFILRGSATPYELRCVAKNVLTTEAELGLCSHAR